MNPLRLLGGLGVAAALGVGVAAASLLREDERVEELMERTHEGKRSPYRKVGAEVAAAAVSWEVVEAALPGFDEMCRALLESGDEDISGSAEGYVAAVKEMTRATTTRNGDALRTAFASLKESCGDCHYDGGVGGELEDDE